MDERRDDRLTTADMAAASAASRERVSTRDVDVRGQTDPTDGVRGRDDSAALFKGDESVDLRHRWEEIQSTFVDEPRGSVERADELVADVMRRLAEGFSQERSELETQWTRGDDVSTEELRVALQRYRSFFDRLLSI